MSLDAATRGAAMTADEPRYGWVVVWATFVALGVIFGVAYSFAAFFEPFAREFSAQRADVSLVFGLCALGYACMVLDIRAYLRSLRRALVLVSNYRPELPEWVRKSTPRCILAFGLTMPCTAEEVRAAYRRKVKELHPDLGGDRREFLRLQAHFEQAMEFLAEK